MSEQTAVGLDETNKPSSGRSRFSNLDDEISLRELIIILWRRKVVIAISSVVGVLVAAFVSIAMTPRYRSTSTIEISQSKEGASSILSSLASVTSGGPDDLKVKMETQIAVLKDDSIALAVIEKLGLGVQGGSMATGSGHTIVDGERLPPAERESLVRRFEKNLRVEQVKNSRLIAITYSSKDPVESAAVANQVVQEYISYLLNSNYSSSKNVSQWLATQLSGLSDQVNDSQREVAKFERSHNLSGSMLGLASLSSGSGSVAGIGAGGSGIGSSVHIPALDRLTALNDEVTLAEATRIEREAIYRLTSTENPDVISSLTSSSLPGLASSAIMSQGSGLELFNSLREQQAALQVSYASAEAKYGAKNPNLIAIENQLKSLSDQIRLEMGKIKQRAKNDLTLAEQNEKSLHAAFEAQENQTSKMNDDVVQLGVLMERARSTRELYDMLYAKLQEANIDAGSSATNVTIADPARPSGSPWAPRPVLYSGGGLLGGIVIGSFLAFLLESQDDTVVDSFQVEALSNLPVLCLIPLVKRDIDVREGTPTAETSPLLLAPNSAGAESFRSLRSGLRLSGIGHNIRILSITSPLPQEGKSYTVYNLGLAFAASGLKTLIIDADLRRPQQHKLFRIGTRDGLADVLSGMGSFNGALVAHPTESNLYLLSAGRRTPLASELLSSGEIGKVLESARAMFDVVLIDNTPVLPVADATVVSTYAEGTIGVMRAGRTSRKALRSFVQTLARNRIHMLGMVMDAVDMSAAEYRSVYGYDAQGYYGDESEKDKS